MADVEFGSDLGWGAGDAYEAGVDVDMGGEALDYAAGADAVDAALGAVSRRRGLPGRRRGYVNAGANKVGGMFTYFVSLTGIAAAGLAGGAVGTGVTQCNTPYQVIDLVIIAAAATFNVTSFFIGDTNMWLGAAAIPADLFFPAVQNRFVRFTTVQRGQQIQVGVQNILAATPPVVIRLALKVRSYRRA